MARTPQECYDIIKTNLQTNFSAAGITINPSTWSTANKLRNICYTIATAQSVSEQLWDVYYQTLQETLSIAPAGSSKWIQSKMFAFQYSTTTPQVLTYTNGVAGYAIISEPLKIIKGCSVIVGTNNIVTIKTAKGSPLEPLDVSQINSAQDYINTIGTAGITYTVVSYDPDKLYIEGEIFYKGVYSAVIQNSVINAIDAYLQTLSLERFGGDIQISDLKSYIRKLEGVEDIKLTRVSCRRDSEVLFAGTDLVLALEEVNRKYTMYAGYIIQEDTTGNTFADKLTFTAV